jgi:hypothetical protein
MLQEEQVIYVNTNIHFWSYLSQFFLEKEMLQTKVVEENQNIHFVLNNFLFFRNSGRLW